MYYFRVRIRRMNRKYTILLHVTGFTFFILLPVLFPTYSRIFVVKEFSSYLFALFFFYVNYFYLVPRVLFQKKYIFFSVVFLLAFAFITVVPLAWMSQDQPMNISGWKSTHTLNDHTSPFYTDIKRNLLLLLVSVLASITFKINDHLNKLNEEKINAELSFLKAQINPHFLFNTLNSIYSLAIVKSDLTPTAIVKLSGMMRYVLSETSEKFVSLEKEMNYINNYIDLQEMRLGETAIVNYSFNGDLKNKVIAPLVLIPFIENAFKHGVNPEETSQIDIQISVSDNHVYLHVFNLKVPHRIDKESYSGIGLENGKNQLTYLYPNKHQLTIEENNFSFSVNLNLEIV